MTHVICRATFCLFWEDGVCTAEEIEYEPDVGCLTLQDAADLDLEEVEEEEVLAWGEEADDLFDDDEDEDEDDWEEDEDEPWEDDL